LDQNGHGGAVFALAVLSLLLAGMMIGAWIGRNSQRIESTGHRILILNQLISRAGQEGDLLTAERLESIRRGKQEELELFLSLEKLHAQVKHTLARKDAAELIARSSIEKNLDFPLTLGEIRGERRRLQNDIAVLAGIIGELKLPVKATYLAGWRAELITGYNRMAATGLLPHDRGRTSAFLGFMLLLAAPFFLASYLAAGSIRDRIPELETLDSLSYRTVSLGFPIYTLGALICGAIWAHYAWGKWWSNDPKEIGSLIVWFVYAIYLHARYVRAWSGTHAAMAAVLGFLLAVLGFVGNSVLGGLHSYG
ncbi:MAG: cytochrome c biogenesis protein CcsA, partial [Gemmatimonadota bacterium]|nr:cytochrome c biogenesis protein CcsA [Gemmatimonadota bacterium]